MGESQKAASSVNRKEKNSFLDDGIGKDFLTSWKSMSVTKDDAMDFGFDTVSTGKNKAFNFEKLDMDFGLDGEFDKLSSFKVDMSDFDLPSPSKKATKDKEVSEDKSSTGKPQGKKSQFNFFDFNEMDNFDFESSLGMVGKASTKNNGKMEVSSDRTEQQSSKTQVSDDTGAFDDAITKNLPASKIVNTSDVEAVLSGPGYIAAKESDCEKSISSGAPILSHGDRSSPENVITSGAEATDQLTRLSEKEISMDKFSQHAKLDLPGPSLIGVDLKRSDLSDRHTQNNDQGTQVYTTPGRKEHENAKIMTDGSSYCETLPLKSSSPCQNNTTSASNNSGKNKSGTDVPTQTVDGNRSAVGDLDLEENSNNSISREASQDIKDNKGNQNLTAELPSALRCSESVVDKVTLTSQHESGGLNLKCLKGEGSEHLVCQATPLETKSHSSYSERMSSMYKSLATEVENGLNSNEAQAGNKSGDNFKSAARESLEGEAIQLVGEKKIKHLNSLSEGFTSDVLPKECKLVGTSRLTGEEVAKRKSFMSASDKNVKNQNPSGLSEKQQAKSNSPTSVNPKLLLSSMELMRNAKIRSVDGNKLPHVRSPKKTSDLSTLKISKAKGAEKSSDSTSQGDTSSQQNPKIDMKVQDTAASETALVHKSTGKKSPPNLSLKRKAFELPNSNLTCLKPLKRVSSPQENRDFQEPPRQVVEEKLSRAEKKLNPLNFLCKSSTVRDVKEPSKRVVVKETFRRIEVEKVCNHEIEKDNNAQSNLNSVPVPVIESSQELNLMDLEISSTIENDGVVRKAEAYAKELEDICNMLTKKHEEAKEILVRSLVNNNNLLMLNHPIYEEKIFKVQKFAAELMSKE